ncbi:MAG: Mur ligase family protein [Reyranellaceae bacterium]
MTDAASLRLLGITVYQGPSVHADRPVVRVDLEIPPDADIRVGDIGGLCEFLSEALALPSGHLMSQLGSTRLPELVGNLASMLHRAIAPIDAWLAVRRGQQKNLVCLVFAHSDPLAGRIAARTAATWVAAFLASKRDGQPRPSPQQARDRFRADAGQCHLGANGRLVVGEAARRGIPWRRVAAGDMTVQLGYGARQKWLYETLIDGQSKLGSDVTKKKHLTNRLLADAGVPVPRQILAGRMADAARAAKLIGYPVVVKPAAADHGLGVHVGVQDERALHAAFADVRRYGPALVEQLITGADYRILVLGNRVAAAARREPASVMGDGRQTVRQLIIGENRNPRRIDGYMSHLLQRIPIDDDLLNQLGRQNLSLESIPDSGRLVRLHGAANMSMGGVSFDVTEELHPDNRLMFVRAARILGLEMAGIDFLARDIGQSYRENGGAICEVNAIPGLRPHIAAQGSPNVVSAIVDHLFPGRGDGRVPTVAVTGTNGKTTTSRMVAEMLKEAGHCVGLATTDGVSIGGVEVASFDLAGIPGAEMVLHDPAVTAAVLETARGGLIRNGMAVDRCDVAAVLNVTDDHIGFDGVQSRQEMGSVKSVVARSARGAVVLNADDPLCVEMAGSARAKVMWWFAEDPSNEVFHAHVTAGRPGVTLSGDGVERRIVVWRDGTARTLLGVVDIPCTFGGRAEFNVQNATAATAIGLAMNLDDSVIVRALRAFTADRRKSRGRGNFIEGWPFRILIDYAHNPAGVASLCRFLATEPVEGRRWLVLTSFGNRLESHFHQLGAAAASSFDKFVCTTNGPRIRSVEEVARLLSDGLKMAGVDPANIATAPSEEAAVLQVMSAASPGDLVVVLSSNASAVVKAIEGTAQRPSPGN